MPYKSDANGIEARPSAICEIIFLREGINCVCSGTLFKKLYKAWGILKTSSARSITLTSS